MREWQNGDVQMAKRTQARRGGGKASEARPRAERDSVGKRIVLDRETFQAVDLLARDSMKSFQELADEAFRDLLDKHHRPDTLREALRDSLADDEAARRKRRRRS